jgi:hypothetical protein
MKISLVADQGLEPQYSPPEKKMVSGEENGV